MVQTFARRIAVLLLLTIGISLSGKAQSALLYEISGKGLKKPSYLFGTIHLICPGDFYLPDALRNKLKETSQLVLELDFDDPNFMADMQKNLMLPDDQHLRQVMRPGAYDTLDKWMMENYKVGLDPMGKMRPVGLMSMMFLKILNCTPESYETRLSQLAAEGKMPVVGLESAQEQFEAFDKMGLDAQAHMVVDLIKKQEEAKKEFSELVTLYKKQDSEGLGGVMNKSEFSMEGMEEELLVKRNQNWISRIQNLLSEKSSFIAVGAGHLGGSKGLVSLLKTAGYNLKPIRF